jgi:hypothetical protein
MMHCEPGELVLKIQDSLANRECPFESEGSSEENELVSATQSGAVSIAGFVDIMSGFSCIGEFQQELALLYCVPAWLETLQGKHYQNVGYKMDEILCIWRTCRFSDITLDYLSDSGLYCELVRFVACRTVTLFEGFLLNGDFTNL